MDNENGQERESEFKSSPLYKMFKAIGGGNKPPEARDGAPEYSRFQAVDDRIVRFFHFFANISAIALIGILFIAFFDVVGAKLHKAGISWISGITGSQAMIQYLHIPLVFLTAGFVTLDQGHTRIDLISSKFPMWLQKIFMLIGHILGAILSFYIAYRTYTEIFTTDISLAKTISSGTDGWAKWPFTLCLIIGFVLLGLSFIWSMVRMIRFWKYPGVNAYYIMHPEKALGPGEGPAPDEEASEAGISEEGGESA